jgi:hypothetical protein
MLTVAIHICLKVRFAVADRFADRFADHLQGAVIALAFLAQLSVSVPWRCAPHVAVSAVRIGSSYRQFVLACGSATTFFPSYPAVAPITSRWHIYPPPSSSFSAAAGTY